MFDKCYDRIPIFFERTTKIVDPVTLQTYDLASEKPCLCDYTNVFQLDLENDNSWDQLLPDPILSNKPLLFKPTELGHINQFPTFDKRRAGMYTPKQMKNFCDNIFHASVSDTVPKKLTRTILTQGNTVRISKPANLERLLSVADRFLMDHSPTPSFFVDKFKETFDLLGYYVQFLGNTFACFFLVKFITDAIIIVLRGLEIRNIPGATFGFVRIMLGATIHFFVLSLQTPMYETDENKIIGNLRMQNVTRNETLAAPMYEENPTSFYPHVDILNNPISISSNITELQGNDPNVFHSSGNAPLNSIVSTHGNAPSTSSACWNNSIHGNALETSNNGNAPNSNGKPPFPHLEPFVISQKQTQKNRKKIEKLKNKRETLTYSLCQIVFVV